VEEDFHQVPGGLEEESQISTVRLLSEETLPGCQQHQKAKGRHTIVNRSRRQLWTREWKLGAMFAYRTELYITLHTLLPTDLRAVDREGHRAVRGRIFHHS